MKKTGFQVLDTAVLHLSFTATELAWGSKTSGHYVQPSCLPTIRSCCPRPYVAVRVSGYELGKLTRDCIRDLSDTDKIYQKYTTAVGIKK